MTAALASAAGAAAIRCRRRRRRWGSWPRSMRRCALVLGSDSGPLHLAVAVGAPTVHLYGPVPAAKFGPWGDPARHVVLTATGPAPRATGWIGRRSAGTARVHGLPSRPTCVVACCAHSCSSVTYALIRHSPILSIRSIPFYASTPMLTVLDEDRHWWFATRTRAILAYLDRYVGPGTGPARAGCRVRRGEHDAPPAPLRAGGRRGQQPEAAGGRARQRGLDAHQGTADDLPFGDGEFDLVAMLDTVEHVPAEDKAFEECRRVLRGPDAGSRKAGRQAAW